MATWALAMLARVGGSHFTSVTDELVELGHRPPNVLVEFSIRTGRYVLGFTYRVHWPVSHFSPRDLASPAGSLMVTGFPVIFVVSTPPIRTCPVTVAAPQRSDAPRKARQLLAGIAGPPVCHPAAVEHGRTAVGSHGERLYLRL